MEGQIKIEQQNEYLKAKLVNLTSGIISQNELIKEMVVTFFHNSTQELTNLMLDQQGKENRKALANAFVFHPC